MNRLIQWMMAAILICGASVLTSCTNDDNPVDPTENLAEKIIGKWMFADKNSQPVPTNKNLVYTFVSPTKAYLSASLNYLPEAKTPWYDHIDADVVISGNKITLTMTPDEHTKSVHEFTVNSIDTNKFIANLKVTVTVDGDIVVSEENLFRLTRVTRDYSEAIIGLWECKEISGGDTYNDANARLEFFEDGTYNFYRKNDAGEWEAVTTREFQDYFVDGTLLATRWKNVDEDELREWWEIANVKGDKMQWKALRENEDGTTFKQIVDWEKVEE